MRTDARVSLEYVVAVVAVAVAIGIRWLLDPVLADRVPLVTLYGAVALAVWFGGWRPALVTVALGYLAAKWMFIEPRGEVSIPDLPNFVGATLFLLTCLPIIYFGTAANSAQRRHEASAQEAFDRRNELEQITRRLRSITNSMGAPVARCSRDLRYLWVSQPYADWLSRAVDDLTGRPIVEVIGPRAMEQIRPYVERVLLGEKVQYEEVVTYKGIGDRWINAIYTATFDTRGEPDGWVAVISDITEHKRMEQALRDADRRKDQFVAMLAHELRNPLASIEGAREMLKRAADDDPELCQAHEVIGRQVGYLARLVDDLLDASRITSGKVTLQTETLDLCRVVEQAVEMTRPLVEKQQHSLSISVPATPLWVEGDAVRLEQIFSNLLGNAAKFMANSGRITLTLRRQPREAVVSVADQGQGITADMLPHLFELFYQGSSPHRANGGLGIGLALVKQLVELHGGSVLVSSAGEGKGSQFTVRLPLAERVPDSSAPPPTHEPNTSERLRVLLIDDNIDATELIALQLRRDGHQVDMAKSGEQGLQLAQRLRPDVILLDIALPGIDGYEVARQLRKTTAASSTMLIAITGYSRDADRERAFQAGFDHYLVKPVRFSVLEQLISNGRARSVSL